MTVDQILSAGRELDALIASIVFGCTVEDGTHCGCWEEDYPHADVFDMAGAEIPILKHYSSDMNAAMQVLEKIYEETKHAKVLRLFKWEAFEDGRVSHDGPWACQYGEAEPFAYADTEAMAICRASLKFFGWAKE